MGGISMHKGYAFVQFTNPFDARSACLGEDGRTVLSQILGSHLGEQTHIFPSLRKFHIQSVELSLRQYAKQNVIKTVFLKLTISTN
ncbi:hypothetical protein HUJ04_000862 [Dendroctonus ponderosae]|nr:hypothetical protein HUJ04_000862 [Dendroctonus ponderosae]